MVNTIRQYDGITFEEISERWTRSSLGEGTALSKRTFHNWLNAISDTLGIDIACSGTAPYKYRIENRGDLKADLMEWALNAFSIGQIATENKAIKDRILLEDIPSADWRLDIILSAMRNGHRIRMAYQPFGRAPMELVTEPYAVKLSRKRWYVICHSEKKNKEYSFGIDRITAIEETEETFAVRKDYSAERVFSTCIGISALDEYQPTEVRLKITGFLRDYIDTLPLHASQRLVEKTDEYTIYAYDLRPDYELVDIICGMGNCCEVLQPLELRRKVHLYALEIAKKNK